MDEKEIYKFFNNVIHLEERIKTLEKSLEITNSSIKTIWENLHAINSNQRIMIDKADGWQPIDK